MSKYSSSDKLSDEVGRFLRYLESYIQKPLCIYESIKIIDENVEILGEIYLYTAWNYFFIDYYDYFVLLIFGTVE